MDENMFSPTEMDILDREVDDIGEAESDMGSVGISDSDAIDLVVNIGTVDKAAGDETSDDSTLAQE